MTNEIWKDVCGYSVYYQVSNFGNVKSVDRHVNNRCGQYAIRKGKHLKFSPDKDGYLRVCLCVHNIKKTKAVHRLVATAF